MALRLVMGPCGSGKTFYVINSIRRLLKERNGNIVLIVPDQATYQMERAILSDTDLKGFMNLFILSFRRLAQRVLLERGGIPYPFITAIGKSMAVQNCLWKRKDDLTIFRPLVNFPGFRQTLSRTLSEMRAYDLSPREILSSLGDSSSGAQTSDLLWQKMHDLAIVYEEYENFLQGRFFDPDDYLNLASPVIKECEFLEDACVFFDGFSGFTPQEYKVIRALLRKVSQVTMTICLDEKEIERPVSELSVFHPSREMYEKITDIARVTGTPVEKLVLSVEESGGRFAGAPLLAKLEKRFRNLSSDSSQEGSGASLQDEASPQKDFSLQIVSVPSPREEVEFLAREILHLVREEGFRFKDITVETRDLGRYADLISMVFEDHEIPFFLDKKRSLSHHPLVELIRAALDMVQKNLDFDSVMRYFKTDLVPLSRDDADKLENFALAHGIRGSMWLTEKPWTTVGRLFRLTDDEDEPGVREDEGQSLNGQEIASLDEARRKALSAFSEFYEAVTAAQGSGKMLTAAFLSQSLLDLISKLGVAQTLEAWREEAEKSGDLEAALEHGHVLQKIVEMLEEAKEILGDQPVDLKTYSTLIQAGLEDLQMGVIPPSLDQVLIAGLERSRQPECRATFLLGAIEGVFPQKQDEDAIFSDRERDLLKSLGMELEPSSRLKQLHENYLVYVALTRPSERLYITYPLGDEKGKALAPSYIVNLIKRDFPTCVCRNVTEDFESSEENALDYVLPGRILGYAGRKLARFKEGIPIEPLWLEVYRYLVSSSRLEILRVLNALSFNNKVKPLGRSLAAELYGVPLYMSVSKLERFTACPFSYFAANGLELKEREVFKLDPRGLGTFFHEAMKTFVNVLVSNSLAGSPDLIRNEGTQTGTDSRDDWTGSVKSLRGLGVLLSDARSKERLFHMQKGIRSFDLTSMQELMDKIVEDLINSGSLETLQGQGKASYVRSALKRILRRAVEVLYEASRRGRFIPAATEIPFSFPADDGVYLRGIVDRIDVLVDEDKLYFYVVDYKSSPRSLDLLDAFYGISLQILVYILAVMETFADASKRNGLLEENIIPVGGLYFTVRDPLVKSDGPMEKEVAERERLKKLKMTGILLRDERALRFLDGLSQRYSEIFPIQFTKQGVSGAGNILNRNDLDTLLRFVAQKLRKSAREILSGKIDIAPYRKGTQRACQYCPYGPLCGFDILVEGNEYAVLRPREKDEILEYMKKCVEEEDRG